MFCRQLDVRHRLQGVGKAHLPSTCRPLMSLAHSYRRRDIGKCETWGAKGSDGRGRIVTCLSCSHRWEDLGLV